MTDAQANPAMQAGPTREELYRQWLDLHTLNPSYYGLLGVPELETDEEAIQAAGRLVKRKLRAYQIGTYRTYALELLAEVGTAVSILTNPEKKKAYDRELYAKWKPAIADTYKLYCESTPHDPPVLEAWLAACTARGIPVTPLLPMIIRTIGPRLAQWPAVGGHSVGLPVNMWLYRDVLILAQCLPHGSLEHRSDSVKHIQRVLGLSEGLARVVAEEVVCTQHMVARQRLVTQARRDPVAMLVRLGKRIRRYGGHLGRHAKLIVAVAKLVGVKPVELKQAIEQLAADREKSSSQRPIVKPRGAGRRPGAGFTLQEVVAGYPLPLIIAVAAGAGLLVLIVLLAIISALVGSSPPTTAGRGSGAETSRPYESIQPGSNVLSPSAAELEALKAYREKYGKAPPPETPATSTAPEAETAGSGDGESHAPTTFFNVPAKTKTPR